jgi:hypothetical protein
LRRGQKGPELFVAPGEWSVVFTYKKDDYDYGDSLAPPGKWMKIDNLPGRLIRLSADRKQILEEGPAFQIVTMTSD